MRFIVIAVGERMPAWVDGAVADYVRRMPRTMRVEMKEIRPEPRRAGRSLEQLRGAEAERIAAAIPRDTWLVALDEHGVAYDSAEFSRVVRDWTTSGRDVAFVIGGPDGLEPNLKARADVMLRLSSFTLPHGLARVVLAEQLYRAMAILSNHPYHRE